MHHRSRAEDHGRHSHRSETQSAGRRPLLRTWAWVPADDRQWLALADRIRGTRPADALAVYLRLAQPLIGQTGNAVYAEFVGLLVSIRERHRLLGTQDELTAYVTALRGAHGRKRNLMRLMEQHGL